MPRLKDPSTSIWKGYLPVPNDLKFYWKVLREKYRLHYPCVTYYILDRGNTTFDSLWGESTPLATDDIRYSESAKRDPRQTDKFEEPFSIHCYVNQGSTNYGVELGIIDQRKEQFEAHFLVPDLMELNFSPRNGDKFFWNDYYYHVLESKPSKYWANSNLFTYVKCNCERYRLGT